MNLFKRVMAGLVAVMLSVSMLAGCGAKDQTDSSSSGTSSISSTVSSELSESENTSIVLTDMIGREVTLEAPAQKIVSAYYLSSSLLIALGVKDRVVGIEMKADTRGLYREAAPEFLELPAVGSGKGINIEETAALEPDLVVLPKKLQDSVSQLEALNIPVVVIDPETLDGFLQTVTLLGTATGTEERAEQLTSYYQQVMDDVAKRTENLENKPTVYLAGTDMLRTAGSGMYQNQLIEIAGGINVAGEQEGDQWIDVSAEQVVAWNPEKVFLVNYSDYSRDDFVGDSRFSGLKAMENPEENVVVFPSDLEPWDYPTASSVLGILWLANQLHPDVVTEEEYQQAMEDFYLTYFGITVETQDVSTAA